jgi:hypothetical protein
MHVSKSNAGTRGGLRITDSRSYGGAPATRPAHRGIWRGLRNQPRAGAIRQRRDRGCCSEPTAVSKKPRQRLGLSGASEFGVPLSRRHRRSGGGKLGEAAPAVRISNAALSCLFHFSPRRPERRHAARKQLRSKCGTEGHSTWESAEPCGALATGCAKPPPCLC